MTTFGMTPDVWYAIGNEIARATAALAKARVLLACSNSDLDKALHVAYDNLIDALTELDEDMIAE
jgi:hypothetical protein